MTEAIGGMFGDMAPGLGAAMGGVFDEVVRNDGAKVVANKFLKAEYAKPGTFATLDEGGGMAPRPIMGLTERRQARMDKFHRSAFSLSRGIHVQGATSLSSGMTDKLNRRQRNEKARTEANERNRGASEATLKEQNDLLREQIEEMKRATDIG